MLVSSIVRFSNNNLINNSSAAQLQNSNAKMSSQNSTHTFGGEHDLSMLNKIDKQVGLDLPTNKFLYKLTFLQEKMQTNHKKSLNILA